MIARLLLAGSLGFCSLPALAGPWVDDIGRSTSMSFPGATPHAPRPNGHSLADGVNAFKAVCLGTNFDKSAVGTAAQGLGWGFGYREQIVPFKTPVDIGGWEAPDASVHAAKTIFFNKRPQCSFVFVPAQPATVADLQTGLSAALDAQPANAAKAVDKKGRPNRRFEPEWRLPQMDGSTNLVVARLSPTVSGAVHLAIVNKAGKK